MINTRSTKLFINLALINSIAITRDVQAEHSTHGDPHHHDAEHHRKHTIFNQTVINFIDGKSYGFDGPTCAMTLKARSEILTILDGKLIAEKTRQGLYTYQGKKYSVRDLAELEAELLKKGQPLSPELRNVLEIAKHDFVEKMHKFMEPARALKKHMIIMIEDFCRYYKLENSLLLKWGEAPTEAAERAMFATSITSFDSLREFCIELTLFLKEFVASCPKGKEQFKQMLNEIQSHKHTD